VLSQKTRYALKALLELATLPAGTTLSSAAISVRRTIPVKFLAAILVELKRDGLVHGRRGTQEFDAAFDHAVESTA
jgi:Rrf2 family protein